MTDTTCKHKRGHHCSKQALGCRPEVALPGAGVSGGGNEVFEKCNFDGWRYRYSDCDMYVPLVRKTDLVP
jgi:hypothetical protein